MNFRSAVIGAVALLLPGLANAVPLTWTLKNAAFSDGGIATGTFVWDADTNALGDYLFAVSGGDTSTFEPVEYSSAGPGAAAGFSTFDDLGATVVLFDFSISAPGGDRDLYISLAAPLTNAGGEVAFDFTSRYAAGECFACNPYRAFATGSVFATGISGGVPEPATWGLMIMGFGVAGSVVRRRRRVLVA